MIGVTVNAPGRVRLVVATDAASFKPKCVLKRTKACIRRDRRTGDWIVLRAVRFIYDGQGFTMQVTSRNALPRRDLRRRAAEAERPRHVHRSTAWRSATTATLPPIVLQAPLSAPAGCRLRPSV